jgi:hypothetical protein
MTTTRAPTVAAQARDATCLELLVHLFFIIIFFSFTNVLLGIQHIKMVIAAAAVATAAQAQDVDNRCSRDKWRQQRRQQQ